jgi:hypothetical protein
VAAASGVVGCYQDMLKATPFASGEHLATEGPATDRVNLWPLLYHRRPATSFLWPVGEVTDASWAVRPLVASYSGKLDLLWPLVHIDPERGRGYVFPLAFWDPDWIFVAPWYRWEHGFGVLPLFTWSRGPDERHFWTPLFGRAWRTEDGVERWLWTPFWTRSGQPGARRHILPLLLSGWREHRGDDPGLSAYALLSLAGVTRRERRSAEHFFPLWFRSRDDQARLLAVLPFYVGVRGADGGTFDAFPLALTGWARIGAHRYRALLPFYFGHEEDGSATHVVPALLSWRHDAAEAGGSWHFLLSLVAWGGGDGREFLRVVPLFTYDRHETHGTDLSWLLWLGGLHRAPWSDSSHFLPFYWEEHVKQRNVPVEENGETTWTIEPTDERAFRVLVFLYDSVSRPTEDGDRYTRRRVLWRLWHDETAGDTRSLDVFPFFTYDREGEENLTWSWLFTFLRYERRGSERGLNVFFLPQIRW